MTILPSVEDRSQILGAIPSLPDLMSKNHLLELEGTSGGTSSSSRTLTSPSELPKTRWRWRSWLCKPSRPCRSLPRLVPGLAARWSWSLPSAAGSLSWGNRDRCCTCSGGWKGGENVSVMRYFLWIWIEITCLIGYKERKKKTFIDTCHKYTQIKLKFNKSVYIVWLTAEPNRSSLVKCQTTYPSRIKLIHIG